MSNVMSWIISWHLNLLMTFSCHGIERVDFSAVEVIFETHASSL